MADEQEPDEEKDLSKSFTNELARLVKSGFDLTTPRLLLHSQFSSKERFLKDLVSLVYCDQYPPKTHWYRNPDDRFVRVSNQLITSILFTGQVMPPGYEWTQCLLSFLIVPPIKMAAGNTLYAPYTKLARSHINQYGNKIEEQPDKEDLNVNVQTCWMHHLDVYMFMRTIIEKEQL